MTVDGAGVHRASCQQKGPVVRMAEGEDRSWGGRGLRHQGLQGGHIPSPSFPWGVLLEVFFGEGWSFQELRWPPSEEKMGLLSLSVKEEAGNSERSLQKLPGTCIRVRLTHQQAFKQSVMWLVI